MAGVVVAGRDLRLGGPGHHPGGPSRPDGALLRYDEIERVGVEGRTVHVNGTPFVTVCSPDFAHHLAAHIEKLAVLPPERREQEIDTALAAAFDAAGAAERFRTARRRTVLLMLLCTLLTLFVFAFLPVSLALEWELHFFQYVLLYVALLGMVMLQYVAAHEDLLPQESKSRRKHRAVDADLAGQRDARPQSTIPRCAEPLSPACRRAALCQPETFEHFARHILLDLREPLPPVCPSTDPAACNTEKWFREKLLAAVLALVRGAGLDPDRLAYSPTPEGPDCLSYCPRCDGQFVLAHGTCYGCAGLPLRRFDAPPPAFPSPPIAPIPPPPPESVAIAASPPEPVPAASSTAPKKVKRRKGKRKRY